MRNPARTARRFMTLSAFAACLAFTASAQSRPGQVSANALRAACSDDVARLCAGVQSGGGRIIACLKQHQDELSDGCRKAGGLPPRANASATGTAGSGLGSGLGSGPAAGSATASGSASMPPADVDAMPDATTAPTSAGTPAAIGQPSHVAGEDFVRRPIVDTAHGNMTVATLHVPQNWTFDSKVVWHYEWADHPLAVSARATNPANGEAFFQYPVVRHQYITVAPQYRQYVKSPAIGPGNMPVRQPIPALVLFIKQARPNVNIEWVGTQDLPGLGQAINVSPTPGDHGIAIKISYDLNGQAVDEAFFGVYYSSQGGNSAVSVGQNHGAANAVQQTNWGFSGLISFRAPAGTLERRMPVFALIAKSLTMNPQWMQLDKSITDQLQASVAQKQQQGYDQLRAGQAAMTQALAQEKSFDVGVNKFDANLRKPFDDSWLRTTSGGGGGAGGHLSTADRASNNMRSEDTVQDSTSSTGTTQLSNAGDYHYTNGLGDYRTYSDPNMTPEKAGESGAWTAMTTVQ